MASAAAASPGARPGQPVQSVTTAPAPASTDRDDRMRRYLIQMGIRTLCFIGACFTTGWVQIVLILGAVVLPYVAVVGANNKGPDAGGTLQGVDPGVPALPARPTEPAPTPAEDVVSGEVVEDGPRALTRGTEHA